MKKLFVLFGALLTALPLLAEEAPALLSGGIEKGFIALGAGLAIGFAALGGGIGQGNAAASAMEGTARNPEAGKRIFVLLILSLAIIESLVIYALVISFSLLGKL